MSRHPIGRYLAVRGLEALVLTIGDVIKQWLKNKSLQWRHNGHDDVSNHQPHHCLLSHLFGRRSKKTSKLRVTGLCAGNSPGTGEIPAQRVSYAENVSIWWRHHVKFYVQYLSSCTTFPGIWFRRIHNERKLRTSVPGINWLKTIWQSSYLVFKLGIFSLENMSEPSSKSPISPN